MEALEAGGNRAGALHHAQAHERLLRSELGVEAVPEVAALADRLRQAPPAAIHSAKAPEAPRFDEAAPTSPTVASARMRFRNFVLILAGLALLALTVRTFWSAGPRPPGSVAVLPFVNLSAGLRQRVLHRRPHGRDHHPPAAIPGLKVISRTSAMHYKGSRKTLPEIAARAQRGTCAGRKRPGKQRDCPDLGAAGGCAHRRSPVGAHLEHERQARSASRRRSRARWPGPGVELGGADPPAAGTAGTRNPDALEFYRGAGSSGTCGPGRRKREPWCTYQRAIALDSA